MPQASRKSTKSIKVANLDQAELISWMTGLQMVNNILLKQLEVALHSHDREGEQLIESLVGLSQQGRKSSLEGWVEQLDESIEILQNRDSVHQQLDGVKRTLLMLNEFVNESREVSLQSGTLPPFETLVKSIYQTYVMASQRDVHHKITGVIDSSENMDRIELF